MMPWLLPEPKANSSRRQGVGFGSHLGTENRRRLHRPQQEVLLNTHHNPQDKLRDERKREYQEFLKKQAEKEKLKKLARFSHAPVKAQPPLNTLESVSKARPAHFPKRNPPQEERTAFRRNVATQTPQQMCICGRRVPELGVAATRATDREINVTPGVPATYRTPYDAADNYYRGARSPVEPHLPDTRRRPLHSDGLSGTDGQFEDVWNPSQRTTHLKSRGHVISPLPPYLQLKSSPQGVASVLPLTTRHPDKRNRENPNSYEEALKQQIREREEQKEREKMEMKKAEMLTYNPWGRGGCGAPIKDHDVVISGFGNEPSQQQQLLDKETKHQQDLKQQIEESRRRREEEKECIRIEEEKEEKRLAAERALDILKYEQELKQAKLKQAKLKPNQLLQNQELVSQLLQEELKQKRLEKKTEEVRRSTPEERPQVDYSQRKRSPPIPTIMFNINMEQQCIRTAGFGNEPPQQQLDKENENKRVFNKQMVELSRKQKEEEKERIRVEEEEKAEKRAAAERVILAQQYEQELQWELKQAELKQEQLKQEQLKQAELKQAELKPNQELVSQLLQEELKEKELKRKRLEKKTEEVRRSTPEERPQVDYSQRKRSPPVPAPRKKLKQMEETRRKREEEQERIRIQKEEEEKRFAAERTPQRRGNPAEAPQTQVGQQEMVRASPNLGRNSSKKEKRLKQSQRSPGGPPQTAPTRCSPRHGASPLPSMNFRRKPSRKHEPSATAAPPSQHPGFGNEPPQQQQQRRRQQQQQQDKETKLQKALKQMVERRTKQRQENERIRIEAKRLTVEKAPLQQEALNCKRSEKKTEEVRRSTTKERPQVDYSQKRPTPPVPALRKKLAGDVQSKNPRLESQQHGRRVPTKPGPGSSDAGKPQTVKLGRVHVPLNLELRNIRPPITTSSPRRIKSLR